jgi:hypothetical protein
MSLLKRFLSACALAAAVAAVPLAPAAAHHESAPLVTADPTVITAGMPGCFNCW